MTFLRRISWWMQRRRREAELREELEFHLDEEADARQAEGLTTDQARLAARRDLGNVTLLREETRTLWSWILLEQLAQDVRFGLRAMRKNRAFTVLAALSLALGIGANRTGPEFFTTMQIPLRIGRPIDERDQRGAGAVAVVVSDLFARAHVRDENPIGRHVTLGGPAFERSGLASLDLEIVGVAESVRYGGVKRDLQPVVYLPYPLVEFPPLREMTFALRTDGNPLNYVSAVRQIVRQTAPRVPVTNVETQAAEIERTINQEIVFARLCSAFAFLALVIACVGLYGTMTFAVARRTNDIGVRVALGARRSTVVWMVLREACILTGLGLMIGVPVALGSSHLIESFLFDMKPNDPAALMTAVAILVIAGLMAGYVPAWRASRISPMTAIRQD